MQNRTKAILSIFVFSLIIYMMITTKYIDALGDYVLKGIGLRPWTGENTGFHLTILYLAIAAFIANYYVMRFAVDEYGMKRRKVFLLTAIFITCFTLLTNTAVIGIKRNSEGLLSIGYDSNAKISFSSDDKEITRFEAEIQLTNYANEERAFYLTIIYPDHRDLKMYHNILTKENEPAIFRLRGKESRLFKLSLQEFNIGYQLSSDEYSSVSGNGNIPAVILTDRNGKEIELSSKNFFGLELTR